MEQSFRKGIHTDTHQLRDLGVLSYGSYKQSMTAENWQRFMSVVSDPDTYTQLLSTSACFVCEHGGQIVGMAFLVPSGHPTEMFESDWSYVRMVGVHPDHSGQGIAKQLTQMCLEHAIETKEEYVALHTSEFMDAARHIYASFGFQVVRELTRYDKKYWIYLLDMKTRKK